MDIDRKQIRSAAQKQLRKGNWSKAIDKYEKLVEDDPDDVRSRLKLADLYTRTGNEQRAVQSYREVGDRHARKDIHQKAVAVYKQAIRLEPDDPELHRKVGEAYHRLDRLKDAAQALRRAHKHYKEAGERDEQLDVLEELVRLDPDDVGLRIQLAENYAKQDRDAEALERFREAAEMLDEEGRLDDYVQVAERILYFEPDDLEVRKKATQIYIDRSDHKRALKHLQVCFNHDPEDEDTLRRLAETFMRLDRTEKAVLVFRKLAKNYEERGRTDSARQVWTRILDLDPTNERAQKALQRLGEEPSTDQRPERRQADSAEMPTISEESEEEPATTTLDEVEFLDEEPTSGPETPEPQRGVDPTPTTHDEAPDVDRGGFRDVPTEQLDETLQSREPSSVSEDDELAETAPGGHDRAEDEVARDSGDSEPPTSLGETSSTGTDELDELLNEVDVFLKYSLHDNARKLLRKLVQRAPDNLEVYEKRRELYAQVDEPRAEASALVDMARLSGDRPDRARRYLQEADELGAPDRELQSAASEIGLDLNELKEPVAAAGPDASAEESLGESTAALDERPASPSETETGGESSPDSGDVMELDSEELEIVDDAGDVAAFESVDEAPDVVEETEILEDDADSDGQFQTHAEVDGGSQDDHPFHEAPKTQPPEQPLPDQRSTESDEDASEELSFSEGELEGALDDLFDGGGGAETHDGGPTLEQIDELIDGEHYGDAREALERFEEQNPDHPGTGSRRRQIESATNHDFERHPTGSRSLSGKFQPVEAQQPEEETRPDGVDKAQANHTSLELGLSYRDMGMYDEAIEEFQEAIADADAAPAAKYHIAVCKAERGDTEEAADDLDRLLRYDQLPDELRDAAREKLDNLTS